MNSGSNARFEDIDISIDGERVALLDYERGPAGGADGRGARLVRTEPILVRAGQQRVSAAFVRKLDGPYEDLIRPHDWSFAGGGSGGPGITDAAAPPRPDHHGPVRRRPAFPRRRAARRSSPAGRPASGEERPCAQQIVSRLGGEAYRRPLTRGEIDRLMPFYERGAATGRLRGRRPRRRSRRFSRARTSSSASSASPRARGRAGPTASPTSTSRRGCRSSCGARRPTRSC